MEPQHKKVLLVGFLLIFTFCIPFGLIILETGNETHSDTPREEFAQATNINTISYTESQLNLTFDDSAQITMFFTSDIDTIRTIRPTNTTTIDYGGQQTILIPATQHGQYRVELIANEHGVSRTVSVQLFIDDAGVRVQSIDT